MAGESQRLWLLLFGVLLIINCLNVIRPVSCRPLRNRRQESIEDDNSVSSSETYYSSSEDWEDSSELADSIDSVFTSYEYHSDSYESSYEETDKEAATPRKKPRTTVKPNRSSSFALKLKYESITILVPVGVLIRTMYPF